MNPTAIESRGIRRQDAGDDPEALRAHLHGMWASVAGAWEANAAYIDARGAAVSARMLELTAPGPGERVLELACGTGGPGLDAADLVGPEGEIVLSDVAVEMTAIAARRAAARGACQYDDARVPTSSGSTSRTAPSTSCSAARA